MTYFWHILLSAVVYVGNGWLGETEVQVRASSAWWEVSIHGRHPCSIPQWPSSPSCCPWVAVGCLRCFKARSSSPGQSCLFNIIQFRLLNHHIHYIVLSGLLGNKWTNTRIGLKFCIWSFVHNVVLRYILWICSIDIKHFLTNFSLVSCSGFPKVPLRQRFPMPPIHVTASLCTRALLMVLLVFLMLIAYDRGADLPHLYTYLREWAGTWHALIWNIVPQLIYMRMYRKLVLVMWYFCMNFTLPNDSVHTFNGSHFLHIVSEWLEMSDLYLLVSQINCLPVSDCCASCRAKPVCVGFEWWRCTSYRATRIRGEMGNRPSSR
jgi:hypothetical protein